DLTRITNRCELEGPIGLSVGFDKPAGIASLYQTLSATLDSTNYWISDSIIRGQLPLHYAGSSALSLNNVYIPTLNGGSADKCAILIETSQASAGNAIYARNLRIENQAGMSEMY